MNRALRVLRLLVREEIGRNYKTTDNDPYQYYETVDVKYDVYPAGEGFNVEIDVLEDETLNPPTRKFPTREEAEIYGRQYIEYVRKVLHQRQARLVELIDLIHQRPDLSSSG